jgi:hypothetical protein
MPSGEHLARSATPAAAVVVAGAAPADALQQDQQGDKAEQSSGKLRRGNSVAQRKPRAVDAGGKRLHREVGHGAVIGQRLHQGQRHSRRDGRARQRNRDAPEALPGTEAERARRLDHAAGAFEEGGAHQQVDVGIEHAGKQHDGAAQRTHVGKPVVALFQPKLSRRPVCRGRQTAGNRYRCRPAHRPASPSAAAGPIPRCAGRENRSGHQPGGAGAHRRDTEADAEAEPDRIRHVLRKNGRQQMAPRFRRCRRSTDWRRPPAPARRPARRARKKWPPAAGI